MAVPVCWGDYAEEDPPPPLPRSNPDRARYDRKGVAEKEEEKVAEEGSPSASSGNGCSVTDFVEWLEMQIAAATAAAVAGTRETHANGELKATLVAEKAVISPRREGSGRARRRGDLPLSLPLLLLLSSVN